MKGSVQEVNPGKLSQIYQKDLIMLVSYLKNMEDTLIWSAKAP